jgi:hypothetical protein
VGENSGVVQMRWWWQWSVAFENARWENELRAKNLKSSCQGPILGALLEMGVGCSAGRCGNGTDEVVMVVRHCIRKHKAGEGAEGQKIESKL